MKGLWRLLLVAGVLTLGSAFFVACEDDESGGDDPTSTSEEEATDEDSGDEATDTPEDGDTDATDEGNGDSEGGSADDIPRPDDAEVTESGSWTSSIPFADPSGGIDPDAFGQLDFVMYDTEMSPAEVIEFYQAELTDWDEVYVLGGSAAGVAGGFGIWTQGENDRAAWIGTAQGTEGGTTTVTVIVGASV
jgi:hypothetical protein